MLIQYVVKKKLNSFCNLKSSDIFLSLHQKLIILLHFITTFKKTINFSFISNYYAVFYSLFYRLPQCNIFCFVLIKFWLCSYYMCFDSNYNKNGKNVTAIDLFAVSVKQMFSFRSPKLLLDWLAESLIKLSIE